MECSIVIPTFNEEAIVGRQVVRCLALRPEPLVVVADGGSSDDTRTRAAEAGAFVLAAPRRGRGAQMNAGAAVARGDVLVFLHTDVALSQAAWSSLGAALTEPDLIGGAFKRRFDSPSLVLALGSRFADLRGRWLQVYLGDQAIFVRREAFLKVGGFPETLLFEDIGFSSRLRSLGRTRLVEEPVLASSRRFDEEGNLRGLSRNVLLVVLYWLGADPDRLARHYYADHFDGVDPGARPVTGVEPPDATVVRATSEARGESLEGGPR